VGKESRGTERKYNCNEPAQYFQARYDDLKESNRAFAANMEKMKDIVDRRKENAEAGGDEVGTGTAITEDAKINDATMVDDAQWGTGRRGPEAEKKLQGKLEDLFVEKFGNRNYEYRQWHTELSRHSSDAGVGNMQGMGYSVFCKWMNGKKMGAKRINARAMKGMEYFAKHWEEGKMN